MLRKRNAAAFLLSLSAVLFACGPVFSPRAAAQQPPREFIKHYNEGVGHANAKRYGEAVEAYRKAIQVYPNHYEAHYNLGRSYHNLQRYAEAADAYRQAIRLKPDLAVAHALLCEALGRAKRHGEAAAACDGAIRLEPKKASSYFWAGYAYSGLGQHEKALQILRHGKQLDSNKDFSFDDMIAATEKIKISKEEIAKLEAKRKSLQAGMSLLRKAVEAEAEYQHSLGLDLLKAGKYAEAEAALAKAVGYSPKKAGWRGDLAFALFRQGKWKRAEAELRSALELEPANPRLLNALGYKLVERGEKLDEALRMIEKAVQAEPRNGDYLDSLGWALFKLGRLEEAAAHSPGDAVIHEHLGDVRQKRGDAGKARASWEKALSLTSDEAQRSRLQQKLRSS